MAGEAKIWNVLFLAAALRQYSDDIRVNVQSMGDAGIAMIAKSVNSLLLLVIGACAFSVMPAHWVFAETEPPDFVLAPPDEGSTATFQTALQSCEKKGSTKDRAILISRFGSYLDETIYFAPEGSIDQPGDDNAIGRAYFFNVLSPVFKAAEAMERTGKLDDGLCSRAEHHIEYNDHGMVAEKAELLPASKMAMQLLHCLCK